MLRIYSILVLIFLLVSCEEVIDINLNNVEPKIVIQADLNDLTATQYIYITKTVDFTDSVQSNLISTAVVKVSNDNGEKFDFQYDEKKERYVCHNFKTKVNTKYYLNVSVDNKEYTSQCTLHPYIAIDSLGIVEDEVLGKKKYAVTLKFNDPAGQENYYKYNMSVNTVPLFEFVGVFNDKFNDGRFVTHQLTNQKNSLKLHDTVTVIRSVIDKSVYNYWSEFQSMNPGTAAPANPTSNISNGALGYFSVASAKMFGYYININQRKSK